VSGPALTLRFGLPANAVPDGHPEWANVAADIGELVASLLLTTSANRIAFGGSVALGRAFLLPAIRDHALSVLNDYLPFYSAQTAAQMIILSPLGPLAGPLGAIGLGELVAGL